MFHLSGVIALSAAPVALQRTRLSFPLTSFGLVYSQLELIKIRLKKWTTVFFIFGSL
jgi:hypothetical protein